MPCADALAIRAAAANREDVLVKDMLFDGLDVAVTMIVMVRNRKEWNQLQASSCEERM